MSIQLSTDEQLYREFWRQLKRHFQARNHGVEPLSALARKWMDLEIGAKPGVAVASLDDPASGLQMTFQLRGRRSAELYFRLRDQRLAIERDIGYQLDWAGGTREDLPPWQTQCYKNNCDLTDLHRWPEYIDWYTDMALRFKSCFVPRMEALLAESPEQVPSSENQLFREYWTQYTKKLYLRDDGIQRDSSRSRCWLDMNLDSQGSLVLPSFDKPTLDERIPGGMQIAFRLLANPRRAPAPSLEACKRQYNQLLNEREAIETELGCQLNWLGYKAYKKSYICYQVNYDKPGCDFRERERWPEYIDWHVDMTLRFKNCFLPRITAMDNTPSLEGMNLLPNDEDDDLEM